MAQQIQRTHRDFRRWTAIDRPFLALSCSSASGSIVKNSPLSPAAALEVAASALFSAVSLACSDEFTVEYRKADLETLLIDWRLECSTEAG